MIIIIIIIVIVINNDKFLFKYQNNKYFTILNYIVLFAN